MGVERRGNVLLAVHGLVGGYRPDLDILHGVDLEVREGEMVSIIGPNGAGKSTLLKAIFGVLPLKSGTVEFAGLVVTGTPPMKLLRAGMSFVPQGRNLFTEMSVEDNLYLGAYVRRDEAVVRQDMERVYALFPILRELRRQVAGYLSGGQMQMLEMGRAMLLKPRLLLVDEPSMGLSPKMAHEVFSKIAEMNSQGVAVLIVEQNAEASLRMSHFAYVVESGRTRMAGAANRLRQDEAVRAAYLGA